MDVPLQSIRSAHKKCHDGVFLSTAVRSSTTAADVNCDLSVFHTSNWERSRLLDWSEEQVLLAFRPPWVQTHARVVRGACLCAGSMACCRSWKCVCWKVPCRRYISGESVIWFSSGSSPPAVPLQSPSSPLVVLLQSSCCFPSSPLAVRLPSESLHVHSSFIPLAHGQSFAMPGRPVRPVRS